MRVTNQMVVDAITRNLSRSQQEVVNLQSSIASGKALARPSDNPGAIFRAASSRADITQTDQYLSNIATAKNWLSATESNLNSVTDLMQRAKVLALQAANDTLSPTEHNIISKEVDELLSEAVQIGNATYNGKYIFGGFKTATAPFTLNEGPPPTVTYNGDSGSMARRIDSGIELSVNASGASVFPEVFDALANLKTDLDASDTASIRATRLSELDTASDGAFDLLGQVGAKIRRLDATAQRLNETETNLKATLSKEEDLDMTDAVLKLSTEQNAYQAALAAAGKILQTNLLDFLK